MNPNILKLVDTVRVHITSSPIVSSFMAGTGLAYSIENNKYHHIPLVLVTPILYSGYQVYKNKEIIKKFIKE